MRDYTKFSDPDLNPAFNRDWGNGRPRIRFRSEGRRRSHIVEDQTWQRAGAVVDRIVRRATSIHDVKAMP